MSTCVSAQPNLTLHASGTNTLNYIGNGVWEATISIINNGNASSPAGVEVTEYYTFESTEANLDYYNSLYQPLICESTANLPALAPGQSTSISYQTNSCDYYYYTGASTSELHWGFIIDHDQNLFESDDRFTDNSIFWSANIAPNLNDCPCLSNKCPTLSVICSTIYEPVCACNGVEYSNGCEAFYYSPARYYTPGECQDACELAYEPFCDESFTDSNDPNSNLAHYTSASDIIDHHSGGNHDGCRTDNYGNAEFSEPEVIYSLTNANYGHTTIDVKPLSHGLDVDLFIYDNCMISSGNGGTRQAASMNCIFTSTMSGGLNDAVMIRDIDNNGNLHAIVDGQSNSNNLNVGDYTFAMTCGYLNDHHPIPLTCGQWTHGSNYNSNNYASYYCCEASTEKGGNYGNEVVYELEITETSTITIDLENIDNNTSTDLNLYLLNHLDVFSCIEYSKQIGYSDESITQELAPGIYYVVVEGYCGSIADYRIKVEGCGDQCTDCSWCFDYCLQPGVEGGSDYYEFYNAYCEASSINDNKGSRLMTTYTWDFPQGSINSYLQGTDANSYEPICRLNPGRWRICLRVNYPGGFYTCCVWIHVPPNNCTSPPPTCGLSYTTSGSTYTFDASTSEGAESYSWMIEDAETKDTVVSGLSDFYEQNINLEQYGNRCYLVTCYVSNCYGSSKTTIKVCVNTSTCNTNNPGGPYFIYPVTTGDELTFEGVPSGYDSYEWDVPEDFTFIVGSTTSQGWRCGIPAGKSYKICLTLRKGCEVYCYCWTVRRGCCPSTPCTSRTLSCDDHFSDDNKNLIASYKTDKTTTYHQHGCFEFKTSGNQSYTPLFRSIEATYNYTQPNLQTYPITIDVFNLDKASNYDPDIFIFESCDNGRLNSCLDYSGHLPPALNESVFIPASAFNSREIIAVVDGQSFSNGNVNQGDYIIGVTCGPITGAVNNNVPIEEIVCGEVYQGNSSRSQYGNHASYYNCDPETDRGNNWGKEVIHRLVISESTNYTIDLTHSSNIDLNLYLLDETDSQSCLDLSKKHSGTNESITQFLSPGTYYVVVDGYTGDEGAYTLMVSGCVPQESCTFEIGEACGGLGSFVDIPITIIELFEGVYDFGFEIALDSPNLIITDIINVHPNLGGLISNSTIVTGNRTIIGWVSESGDAVTIPDGEVAFYLRVEITDHFTTPIVLYSTNDELSSVTNLGISVLSGEICFTESVSISGNVHTPSGNPKAEQVVSLSGVSNRSTTTDVNGNYQFVNVMPGSYQITCIDNTNLKEGVSISDVGLLRRHYLEKQFITDDYNLLAGDINKNGAVTISDVGLSRRIYLEKLTQLTDNTSWRFVPADLDISSDPMDPNLDGTLYIMANTNIVNADILAIKVGDVNNTVNRSSSSNLENRSLIDLTLNIGDTSLRPNTTKRVPVTAQMNSDLYLMGMELAFDSEYISVSSIIPGSISDITASNYNILDGRILIGWEEANGVGINLVNDTLFYIEIKSTNKQGKTDLLITDSEILDGDFEEYTVSNSNGIITIDESVSTSEEIEFMLNIYPNPFSNAISVELPKGWNYKDTRISIYNGMGQVIGIITPEANLSNIDMTPWQLGDGLYIIRCAYKDQSYVKTMIKL